jgi:AcrR family transcriptional regulator
MSTVKSRREEYSDATRAALLDSATQLFSQNGFVHTSLDDVARATRMTRGAVYHHFNGKQALFEAVLENQEIAMQVAVGEAAAKATGAWDASLAGLDTFLDFCCDPVYGRIVMQEGPVALGWPRWRELEQVYAYGLTEQFIVLLIEAKLVDPVPLPSATQVIFGLLSGSALALVEALPEDRPRVREECGALIRRILVGLHPSVTQARPVN